MNASNIVTPLAVCIAMLLAACGGGGDGIVRDSPPPQTLPPPPTPPPTIIGPCPMPITGDCVVTTMSKMGDGRSSDYALLVLGEDGHLFLSSHPGEFPSANPGTYRFAGGTVVGGAGWQNGVVVNTVSTLESNVLVNAASYLAIEGTVRGHISNHGEVWVSGGAIVGTLRNDGYVYLDADTSNYSGQPIKNLFDGDFLQGPAGELSVSLPTSPMYPDYRYTFNVTGRAELVGTLELRYPSNGWDPYPLPTTPTTAHILHADGGVFGQFDRWTSPELFIEGSLRYGTHDVWFDLVRVSVLSAMAAQGVATPMALAGATRLDAALATADRLSTRPPGSLTASERQFLASATCLLYLRDVRLATAALTSLAAPTHLRARDSLHARGAQTATRLDGALRAAQAMTHPWQWSTTRIDGHGNQLQRSGFGQWVGPHWLFGAQAESTPLDRASGEASTQVNAHLHYRGEGWHATGLVGGGRTLLESGRAVSLGAAGVHAVRSQRMIDQRYAHAEVGRHWNVGQTTLTPFIALDYSRLDSHAFGEWGTTGFELLVDAGRASRLDASLGLRVNHEWALRGPHWIRVDLEARLRRTLSESDTAMARFIGAPAAAFRLGQGWTPPGQHPEMSLGLACGGRQWQWHVDHLRERDDRQWQFSLLRPF